MQAFVFLTMSEIILYSHRNELKGFLEPLVQNLLPKDIHLFLYVVFVDCVRYFHFRLLEFTLLVDMQVFDPVHSAMTLIFGSRYLRLLLESEPQETCVSVRTRYHDRSLEYCHKLWQRLGYFL